MSTSSKIFIGGTTWQKILLSFNKDNATNAERLRTNIRFASVPSFPTGTIGGLVVCHLTSGCHFVSDGLKCYPATKKACNEQIAIIAGGGTKSDKILEFNRVNTVKV